MWAAASLECMPYYKLQTSKHQGGSSACTGMEHVWTLPLNSEMNNHPHEHESAQWYIRTQVHLNAMSLLTPHRFYQTHWAPKILLIPCDSAFVVLGEHSKGSCAEQDTCPLSFPGPLHHLADAAVWGSACASCPNSMLLLPSRRVWTKGSQQRGLNKQQAWPRPRSCLLPGRGPSVILRPSPLKSMPAPCHSSLWASSPMEVDVHCGIEAREWWVTLSGLISAMYLSGQESSASTLCCKFSQEYLSSSSCPRLLGEQGYVHWHEWVGRLRMHAWFSQT